MTDATNFACLSNITLVITLFSPLVNSILPTVATTMVWISACSHNKNWKAATPSDLSWLSSSTSSLSGNLSKLLMVLFLLRLNILTSLQSLSLNGALIVDSCSRIMRFRLECEVFYLNNTFRLCLSTMNSCITCLCLSALRLGEAMIQESILFLSSIRLS